MEPHRYAPRDWDEVAQLVERHPLAWVVSGEGGALENTPLPLRARRDAVGRIVRLDGHFARSNPHVQALTAAGGAGPALILFMGLNGYVSASWMADRTQAPTWVYATAAFQVRLQLFEDPAHIGYSLRDLVQTHESGREKAWSVEEMGARYAQLTRGVVAFEADVLSVKARFKLGQDEREDVFQDIVQGLEADGRAALVGQLRRPEP